MSATADIATALMTRMVAFTAVAADRIAWPGLGFLRGGAYDPTVPPDGQWIETAFFALEPDERYIGAGSPAHRQGWFQATVCERKGGGVIDLLTLAEQVAAHFPRGASYTHNDVCVRVRSTPGPQEPFEDDGVMRAVVRVQYFTVQ